MTEDPSALLTLVETQRRELDTHARSLRELGTQLEAARARLDDAVAKLAEERELLAEARVRAYARREISAIVAFERRAQVHGEAISALEGAVEACGEAVRGLESKEADAARVFEQARATLRATEARVEAMEAENERRRGRQKEAEVDDLSAARWYDSRRQEDDGT